MQKTTHRYEISWNSTGTPKVYGSCRLYQVGRIHMNPCGVIGEHLQRDYFELTIATDGKGRIRTNGVTVPVSAGDIYLSFPGDFHAIESERDDPLKFDFITVDTQNEALALSLEKVLAASHDAGFRLFRERAVSDIASRILSEVKAEGASHADLYIESLIYELLVLLIRVFEGKAPRTVHGVEEDTLLSFRLMHYIDNHIYSLRGLSELSALTGYTYNYLSNLFRKTTGETLSHYYKTRRLEAAQLLLREGTSVTETASTLGYGSIYAFSSAFSHHFGFPPSHSEKVKIP